MAVPYTPVVIVGYNLNPPPDDGTQTPDNLVEWDKHLDKIGNPLKSGHDTSEQRILASFQQAQLGGAALDDINAITFAQGDILFHNGSNLVKLPADTAGQVLTTQGAGADPVWATNPAPAFTSKFTSAEQTITSAGSLTLAHGLGVMPEGIQARIVCKTAEDGYSVDDELIVNNHFQKRDNNNQGHAIVVDATNIRVRFGSSTSVYQVLNFSNGTPATLTNANWRLVVRAWA